MMFEVQTLVVCVGYDIRTESGYDEMMHDLQQFIGLNYLKAVHMNDSRGEFFLIPVLFYLLVK